MSVATCEIIAPDTSLPASRSLGYIPELDGLRGLAILFVLVCHFGYLFPESARDWLSLGWVGVDLFFVLSGFLITRILLTSRGEPAYFRNFYLRRAIRIFPLYFLFVGGYFFLLLPAAHRHGLILNRSGTDQLWFWSYLANWHTGSAHSTLTHLWSLAIEEQFYFAWPLIVALVSPKRLGSVCLGLILLSPAVRTFLIWHFGFGREASFFTVCRMEGIALGALLASGFRVPKPRFAILVVAISLVPLLWRGGPNGFAMTVAGVTLVAILFASLLQLVTGQDVSGATGSQMLRSLVLTRLGKYSYAIYLFHILFLTVAVQLRENRGWPATPLFAGGIIASYGVGWLSWQVFEKRVLMLKRYFPRSAGATADEQTVPQSGEKTSKVAEICILHE
jgi:peptidoglycan/LPS O-acetylase OafA/YrhL